MLHLPGKLDFCHYERTTSLHYEIFFTSKSVILLCYSVTYVAMSAFFCFSSVQSLNHVQLFATPWTAAHQASLFITNSRSLLKLMSIELLMTSNHLIHCHPLLLPPLIFPSIRVFSNESVFRIRWPKYWSFSFSIIPSKEIPG